MRSMSLMRAGARVALLSAVVGAAGAAQADIIWQEAFTGQANGANPSTDFTANTTQDWVLGENGTTVDVRVTTAAGNAQPALTLVDTLTSTPEGTASVPASQWATFSTANGNHRTLRATFDMRVDRHTTGTLASVPRFRFLADNAAGVSAVNVGFGRANANTGQAGDELFFYAFAGADSADPTAATAIGLSGGAFIPGFDFGVYDTVTPENNDTTPVGVGATGPEFYRIVLDYTPSTGVAGGRITRLADESQFADFTLATIAARVYDNTTAAANADQFRFNSGQAGQSTAVYDNITIEAVPEPGAVGLAAVASLGALLRRRRR
ncbi:MAG TPA: hypothetical protein VEA69_09920 [Tepidisphaeraceae bacterium]|nr:hypothetical protein [Tepidisphaeraceae bacterium]